MCEARQTERNFWKKDNWGKRTWGIGQENFWIVFSTEYNFEKKKVSKCNGENFVKIHGVVHRGQGETNVLQCDERSCGQVTRQHVGAGSGKENAKPKSMSVCEKEKLTVKIL
jgi:hypothetical protein